MGRDLIGAAEQWSVRVRASDLGDHPYHMPPEEAAKF
jgi:hypothetical protein